MTLGSLFSGSGGFELAGLAAGIEPLWASEIEPLPILVTQKNIPEMRHFGDISKINGAEISKVDIITGGSPCQDMSIAGKREGLDGDRSGLFREFIRIVKEMRQDDRNAGRSEIRPRFMVWENVPGAFSSNKGADFREVLQSIAEVNDGSISIPGPAKGKWKNAGCIVADNFSIAWRVLDAQYWGVPQRRRRIFLVADFGGWAAPEILFKREGLSRNFKESVETWQGTASYPERSTGKTSRDFREGVPVESHPQDCRVRLCEDGKVQTLTGKMGTGGGNVPLILDDQGGANIQILNDSISPVLKAETHEHPPLTMQIRSGSEGGGKGVLLQEEKSAALRASYQQALFEPMALDRRNQRVSGVSQTLLAGNGGETIPCIAKDVRPIADKATRYKGGGDSRNDDGCGNGLCIGEPGSPAYTLTAAERHAVAYSLDKAAYNQGENASYGIGIQEEVAHTVTAGWQPPAVAYDCRNHAVNEEISGTLQAKENGGQSLNYINPVAVPEKAGTLTAKMAKGTGGPAGDECQNLVAEYPEYIVRRLTPLECCRLQGFPDSWMRNLKNESPDGVTVSKWEEIFETHRLLTGQPRKRRSQSQIIRWLKKPDSDTNLYKMWGNGLALPCAMYVMEGIADVLKEEEDNGKTISAGGSES